MDSENTRKPEIPKINLIQIKEAAGQVSHESRPLDSITSLGFLDHYNAISYKRERSFEPLIRLETFDYSENASPYDQSARSLNDDLLEITDISLFRNSKGLGKREQEYHLGDLANIKKFTFKPSNFYLELSTEVVETIFKDYIQVRSVTNYEIVDQLPSDTPLKEFRNAA
jgi:hypothetical protein